MKERFAATITKVQIRTFGLKFGVRKIASETAGTSTIVDEISEPTGLLSCSPINANLYTTLSHIVLLI